MAEFTETLAEAAHDAWWESKRDQGMTSRRAEWGEELMVPYANLSDQAKDLDRATVEGVLAATRHVGLMLVPRSFVEAVMYSGAFEGERLERLWKEAEELLNA